MQLSAFRWPKRMRRWRPLISLCLASIVTTFVVLQIQAQFSQPIKILSFLARLDELNVDYNPGRNAEKFRLYLGPKSVLELGNYTNRIKRARHAFDSPSAHPTPVGKALQKALDTLNPVACAYTQDIAIPLLINTITRNTTHLPVDYAQWQALHPNWQTQLFDDQLMTEWINSNLPGSPISHAFQALPKTVLKTDLFRYILIFIQGGIYTDSDTAPTQPFSLWGALVHDKTDNDLLQLAKQARNAALFHSSCTEINEYPPTLVVAIESEPDGWSFGHLAGFQVYQSSFAAGSGHPVFLDVIQSIVDYPVTHDVENMSDRDVLAWTGPNIWAEVIWRYLLARWGFDFSTLEGQKNPVRIGDVLVLPLSSFQANYDELATLQTPTKYIWHGSYHRWRTDMAVAADVDY